MKDIYKLVTVVPKTRSQAVLCGAKMYLSGAPCRHGHIAYRRTSNNQCLVCIDKNKESAAIQKKIWYRENKKAIDETSKRYREKNKDKLKIARDKWIEENKERFSETSKRYMIENKEMLLAKNKEYRENNKNKIAARKAEKRRKNLEDVRIRERCSSHKRRSITKKGCTPKELSKWVMSQLKACYWCKKDCKENYHIDHYTPLSKGGAHEIDNLVISCPTCNLSKNAKDPYEFAKTKGMLF